MKRKMVAVILIFLILSGCLSKTNSTQTTPVITPSFTATLELYADKPVYVLPQNEAVFAGPANLDFDTLEVLEKGTAIKILGEYVDFMKIYNPVNSLEGYIYKKDLAGLPSEIPVLGDRDVPWIVGDYFKQNCMGPFATIDSSGTVNLVDYTSGPANFGEQGAPFSIYHETQFIMDIETNGNTAWVAMVDIPPRYNDNENWMYGYRSIAVFRDIQGMPGYTLEFRDGIPENTFAIPLSIPVEKPFKLVVLDSYGKALEVRDLEDHVIYHFDMTNFTYDGKTLNLPDGLFPTQQINLSCNVNAPNEVTMKNHEIQETPTGKWQEPDETLPSLKDLAKQHDIDIILPFEGWRLGDYRLSATLHEQASMVYLTAMMMESGNFWLGIDEYNFEFMDHLLEYIRDNGWKVTSAIAYGHTYLLPADLQNGDFTRDEYIEILHDYVTTITCRYKDQVDVWQIASETAPNNHDMTNDFWGQRIGPEYVGMAFKWARECDPDGILILPETIDAPRDEIKTTYIQDTLNWVKLLQSEGVPIDGVGFEGHLFLPWDPDMAVPTKEGVIETMRKFADLGLDVYITEMDVGLFWYEGTEEERLAFQADMYQLMMDACLEAGNCKSFGVFGMDDRNSWLNCLKEIEGFCPPDVLPEALMFDDNFKAKPAFWAVVKSLQDH